MWFMLLLLVFGLPYHALDDLFEYEKNIEKKANEKNVISIFFRLTKATCFFITPKHHDYNDEEKKK